MALSAKSTSRLAAIDAVRGFVMIIMALDHTRDFFHYSAMHFSPTDLTQTTPVLFFTRWITHFCLPVFMFAAGMGAFLFGQRNRTKGQLSWFLFTRGIWFVFLELVVMQFSYDFTFSSQLVFLLLILWIFGVCMMMLSVLVYIPVRLLAGLSIGAIMLHNLLDSIKASSFGAGAWAWKLIHEPGIFTVAGRPVLTIYPILPWVAVMSAGYCFGQIFLLEKPARRRIMVRLGLAMTCAFVVLRAINKYSDPFPWTHQKSAIFTVLSFLNCTKYPGSLDFLLMTLGPAILLLAYFDSLDFKDANPLIVFGRVPLFYFVLHFYLIHAFEVLAGFLRYGSSAAHFIFNPPPAMLGPEVFPPDFGYSLLVTYGVWLLVLVALYPVCRWFAKFKATHRDWWLSYL
ncbi:MAG TPA: heparan-alpha-glucosaminide N-acetyltransferase domain-containing protein [Candidatus Dormibacteraeota bacterium]|nr:heparan-alpha-glucosaminide N-acetyltransferase domain-containing protein [Candidatus Dormibacteraeota bacterium]